MEWAEVPRAGHWLEEARRSGSDGLSTYSVYGRSRGRGRTLSQRLDGGLYNRTGPDFQALHWIAYKNAYFLSKLICGTIDANDEVSSIHSMGT